MVKTTTLFQASPFTGGLSEIQTQEAMHINKYSKPITVLLLSCIIISNSWWQRLINITRVPSHTGAINAVIWERPSNNVTTTYYLHVASVTMENKKKHIYTVGMHSKTPCTKYPSCIFKYIPFPCARAGGISSQTFPLWTIMSENQTDNTTTNSHILLLLWIFFSAFMITLSLSMWYFMDRIFMSYKKEVVITDMYTLSCSHDITTTNLSPCKTCITTKIHTRAAFQRCSYRSHSNDDTRSCLASKDRNRASHRKQLWEPLWQV